MQTPRDRDAPDRTDGWPPWAVELDYWCADIYAQDQHILAQNETIIAQNERILALLEGRKDITLGADVITTQPAPTGSGPTEKE
jgi:hypothetical protein